MMRQWHDVNQHSYMNSWNKTGGQEDKDHMQYKN